MNKKLRFLTILFVLSPMALFGQGTLYDCINDFYYYRANGRLYSVNFPSDLTDYSIQEIGVNDWNQQFLSALAYDANRGLVYGVNDNEDPAELVVLNNQGQTILRMPISDNFLGTDNINAGIVIPEENTYYALRRSRNPTSPNPLQLPALILRFNLNESPIGIDSIPITTVSGSSFVDFGHVEINPIDGLVYGYDRINRRLITIELETGVVDDTRYPSVDDPEINPWLLAFRFTAFGDLIAISSDPVFRIVRLSTLTGLVEGTEVRDPSWVEFNSTFGSGFHCPYTIGLRQRSITDTISECASFIAEITMGVISDGDNVMVLRDSFPTGFIVEEILRNPYGGSVTGLGTNVITISDFRADNGVDTILLRVRATPLIQAGDFTFQSTLNDLAQSTSVFPANTIRSDYLPTQANPDPSPITIIASLPMEVPDTSFQRCADDVVTLDPFSDDLDATLRFAWSTGATTPEITVSTGGLFTLQATDLCGTARNYNFTVTDGGISADLGDDLFGNYGNAFPLNPSILTTAELQTIRYFTTDTSILSCTDCPSPTVRPFAPTTTINLEVSTIFGCQATDSLVIRLDRPVYQPSAFSPNSDGINDCFEVLAGGPVTSQELTVYDRWGGLIFSSADGDGSCDHGWDGRVDGRPAAAGVYTYVAVLTFPDGSTERRNGVMTLLR